MFRGLGSPQCYDCHLLSGQLSSALNSQSSAALVFAVHFRSFYMFVVRCRRGLVAHVRHERYRPAVQAAGAAREHKGRQEGRGGARDRVAPAGAHANAAAQPDGAAGGEAAYHRRHVHPRVQSGARVARPEPAGREGGRRDEEHRQRRHRQRRGRWRLGRREQLRVLVDGECEQCGCEHEYEYEYERDFELECAVAGGGERRGRRAGGVRGAGHSAARPDRVGVDSGERRGGRDQNAPQRHGAGAPAAHSGTRDRAAEGLPQGRGAAARQIARCATFLCLFHFLSLSLAHSLRFSTYSCTRTSTLAIL